MACQEILGTLVQQYKDCGKGHCRWPGYDQSLTNRDMARGRLEEFLALYPFRENSAEIEARLRSRDDVFEFLRWLVWELRPLGGIQAVRPIPAADEAARRLGRLHDLVKIAVSGRSLAEKIDAWDIPHFRGDHHIAKKIVATFYSDDAGVLPIFATRRLEYHAGHALGINIDAESTMKYGLRYADVTLTVGQKWELLTQALLARKEHHEVLRQEDNVYFMCILEHGLPAQL